MKQTMSDQSSQFLIAGAGITGLTVARELLARGADDISVIEKESSAGQHASGHNSGVLHAGVYYTPDTLKAKVCVEGNRLMKQYCRENGLALRECGKVIVAKNEAEIKGIYELKERAERSGAKVSIIDQRELKEIEPYAATAEKALFSPNTAIVRPAEVLSALQKELERSGKVRFLFNQPFLGLRSPNEADTSKGPIEFKTFINAAGAYADKLAHKFGVGRDYNILPFKGTYKKVKQSRAFLVRANIYPLPDLRNPFLGVHLTRNADDEVYVGPTAIPALGRENYHLLDNISAETASILYKDAILLFTNAGFRSAAQTELKRYWTPSIYEEARSMAPELREDDLEPSEKVGIRAQLVHWPSRKLVMDFVVERAENSVHVLNAISPAFTCSMAFAKHIVDICEGKKGS